MSPWRRFFLRLANVFRPARAEPDLAREVASHLTLLEDDFERRGMTPEDARLAARRAFGGVEQAKDRHRDARGRSRERRRYPCGKGPVRRVP